MTYHYINCQNPQETHRMAYLQWGEKENPKVLVCVHGLTRNSRDFDYLVQNLEQDYRIICPDIVGRGESDWLSEPQGYGLPQYVTDILTMYNQLSLTQVDWIGTSMGGLIGMLIAANYPTLIRRLVLNDVGAFIPKEALERIANYLLQPASEFVNLAEVDLYVRKAYAPFGQLTESQWQHFAKYTVKSKPEGSYRLHYDPNISHSLQAETVAELKDIDLLEVWQKIQCPVLLLHGENSDLLLPETIDRMQEIQPKMDVIHFPDCGHAPALMSVEQIETVRNWLLKE